MTTDIDAESPPARHPKPPSGCSGPTSTPSAPAGSLGLAFDLIALGGRRASNGSTPSWRPTGGCIAETYRRVLGREHPAIAAASAGERANCDVDPPS